MPKRKRDVLILYKVFQEIISRFTVAEYEFLFEVEGVDSIHIDTNPVS